MNHKIEFYEGLWEDSAYLLPEYELIYLAVPYTDKDPNVQIERFHKVNIVASKLLKAGFFVFSPISHSHPIATEGKLEGGWDFWEKYCRILMSRCNAVAILTLNGWGSSVGVTGEIDIAMAFKLPVFLIDEDLRVKIHYTKNGY